MKKMNNSAFDYILVVALAVLCLAPGWHLVGYFDGGASLNESDHTWLTGKLEKVNYYESPTKTRLENCNTNITIKLENSPSYFTIGRERTWNACYQVIDHPVFEKYAEQAGTEITLQLPKEQVTSVGRGEKLLLNPFVHGLKIEGNVIFTVKDLSESSESGSWMEIIFFSVLLLLFAFGLLGRILILLEKK